MGLDQLSVVQLECQVFYFKIYTQQVEHPKLTLGLKVTRDYKSPLIAGEYSSMIELFEFRKAGNISLAASVNDSSQRK